MIISNKTLDSLKAMGLTVPSYDRISLKPMSAHMGLGHFHRSHFLTYMDNLLDSGLEKGGVFEVDVIPADPDFIKGLKAQDYLYSVLSMRTDGKADLKINGSIVGYANQGEDPETVHAVLSSPDIRLITLTITEKGYTYLGEEKTLDWSNASIIHDLSMNQDSPISAVGCLAKALKTRFEIQSPVTIMSCDNVPENGKILRQCILQFCERKYPEITAWVAAEIAFPCTMVDRITPGTSANDIKILKDVYNIEDYCPVHCEDFSQWVIEDIKCTPLPDFAKVGAIVVDDVKPYELMKIRLLNGSHSALSYPAYMMGIKMVHEAAQDPVISTFIRDYYMEQISSTLLPVPGIDLDTYKDSLISRFSNPHIADTILRLASDGSKKILNAILQPLEEGLQRNLNVDALILTLAIWQYFYIYKDENDVPMPIDDPMKDDLLAVSEDSKAFLGTAGLSKHALGHEVLFKKMDRFISMLRTSGVRSTLCDFISR